MQKYKSKAFLLVIILVLPSIIFAQAPSIQWQKCLGGNGDDGAFSMIQTSDGGFVLAGYTSSIEGDVSDSHGYSDFWVIKTDSLGAIEWQKSLGGSGNDYAYSIIQTSDEGYVVTGYTNSTDFDISGNHGGFDSWIVKLDNAGNIEWKNCLGGTNIDLSASIIQISDGSYILGGKTNSNDDNVSGLHPGKNKNGDQTYDGWIVKLNSSGILQWQKCIGGSGDDAINCIAQTNDNGFILAGSTNSIDGDVSGKHGDSTSLDGWIVKLDSTGKIEWQKCIGGNQDEEMYSVIKTSDSGYVAAGYTTSLRDTPLNHGGFDYLVVKLNSTGITQWEKSLGGTGNESARSVIQTTDGGYAVAGYSSSNDGEVSGYHTYTGHDPNSIFDAWIVKLNLSGDIQWQKCFGGGLDDEAYSIIQTKDGRYAFTGSTQSTDGDVSGFHGADFYDVWLVKLNVASGVQNISSTTEGLNLSTYPNPTTNNVTLGFDLPKSSAIDVSIYNITGEKLQEINRAEQPTGHNEVNLDLSKFSDGTYFVKVAAGGMSETKEISVVR